MLQGREKGSGTRIATKVQGRCQLEAIDVAA
jgi:hypothetical protein